MGNTCPLHYVTFRFDMFICGLYKFYCSGFPRALFGLGPRVADSTLMDRFKTSSDVLHATHVWIRPALCQQSVAGSQCHF